MVRLLDTVNYDGIPLRIESPTDVFGYLTTTQPDTLLDLRNFLPSKREFLDDTEVSGTGTSSTYNTDGYLDLTVGVDAGVRIARSKTAIHYQNAKAPIAFFTGHFLTDEPNVVKSVGLAFNNDYIFLENANGQIRLNFGSNNIANSIVNRNDWDDPLLGGNPSGYTLDLTRTFIFFITFQYLGVGGVFCGFKVGTKQYIVHQFNKDNTETLPYWKTPNLFPTYKIEKSITGGNPSTLRQVCTNASSNGTGTKRNIPLYINNSVSLNLGSSSSGQYKGLMYFRLNPLYINNTVTISDISFLMSANNEFKIAILRNPTLNGLPPVINTWTDLEGSSVQYYRAVQGDLSSFLDVNDIDIKLQTMGTKSTQINPINEIIQMTSRADGTPDVYCLGVQLFDNNQTHLSSYVKLLEDV